MHADDEPRWEPLLALFPGAGGWTWLGWAERPYGGRVERYRHDATGRDLSLDHDGGTWVWDPAEGRCRPCRRQAAVRWALGETDERPRGW